MFLLKYIFVFITLHGLGACEAYLDTKGIPILACAAVMNVDSKGYPSVAPLRIRIRDAIKTPEYNNSFPLARHPGLPASLMVRPAASKSEAPSHGLETPALSPKILDGVFFRDAAAYEEAKKEAGKIAGSCLLICRTSSGGGVNAVGMLVDQGRFIITNAHVINKAESIMVLRHPDFQKYKELPNNDKKKYKGRLSSVNMCPGYGTTYDSQRANDIAVCAIEWEDPSILPLETIPLTESLLKPRMGCVLPYAPSGVFGDRISKRSLLSTLAVFAVNEISQNLAQSFIRLSSKTLADVKKRMTESRDANLYDTDEITFPPEHRLCALLSPGASGAAFVGEMADKYFIAGIYRGKIVIGDTEEIRMEVTLFTNRHITWMNDIFRDAATVRGKAKKTKRK